MKRALTAFLLLLAATAGALAQSAPANLPYHTVYGRLGATPGDTGPGSAIPFATLGAQLGISGIPAVTIESQHGGCNVIDNTQALLDAVASVAGPVRVLFPNPCTYNFRQTNILKFSKAAVYLEGTGERSTTLQYFPNADGTFLQWSNGVNVMFSGGARNLALLSTDRTFAKVMLSWWDVSGFLLDDVLCAGGSVGAGLSKLSGGSGSSCFYSHGRDGTAIRKITARAQIPIHIGLNPHAYQSADHYHFSDLTLIGDLAGDTDSTTFPLIQVDPGVVFTSTTFDGAQEWVGGAVGFNYTDTAAVHFVSAVVAAGTGYTAGVPLTVSGGTCTTPITITPLTVSGAGGVLTAAVTNPGVCSVNPTLTPATVTSGGAQFTLTLVAGYRLKFANVRSEQGTSGSAYSFNIQPKSQLQGLVISNSVFDPIRCGAFFKNTFFPTIEQSSYGRGGCATAVSATSANSNDMLHYIDDFWDVGSVHDVSGMTAVRFDSSPTGTAAAVPPTGLWSSNISGSTVQNLGIAGATTYAGSSSGTTTVQALAAASGTLKLPAATGTLAANASAPIVENATTGNLTCPTCVTSSGGGPITGTAPIAVSAAGVVSLNNTAVTPASYGSPTTSPTYTVDAQGRLTAAANVTITGTTPGGAAGGSLSGTYPNPALSSLVAAGGPTGSATVAPIITYNIEGRLTGVSSATITPAASSITGAGALTKTDDTNVTLTLGGTPSTALLAAASLTLGWTSQLSVARGGTGIASGTSGGIPYFSGSNSIASSGALAANSFVIGGGAGVAPSTTTTGSGVITAVGNSVNAASGLATVATQTPTITDGSGAALGLTVVQEGFQVGNMVHQLVSVTYPSTASGATAQLNGLAVTVPNRASASQCFLTRNSAGFAMFLQPIINTKNILMFTSGGAAVTNANLTTAVFSFECIYPAT